MLLVAPVKKELCKQMTEEEDKLFGIEKLNVPRSSLPAITHVDYSARVQTVSAATNPRYYKLISAFKKDRLSHHRQHVIQLGVTDCLYTARCLQMLHEDRMTYLFFKTKLFKSEQPKQR